MGIIALPPYLAGWMPPPRSRGCSSFGQWSCLGHKPWVRHLKCPGQQDTGISGWDVPRWGSRSCSQVWPKGQQATRRVLVSTLQGTNACKQSSPTCLLGTQQAISRLQWCSAAPWTGRPSPSPLLPHTPVLDWSLQSLPQGGMRQHLGKRIPQFGKRIFQLERTTDSAYNKAVRLEEEKSRGFFCCRFSCCYFWSILQATYKLPALRG